MLASCRRRASLIRDAEVGEYRDPSAGELYPHGVFGAAEFDGRAALQHFGVDVANSRRQRLALPERPRDAPLRAADFGGHHLVLVRVVAIGDDAEPQAIEHEIAIARLVRPEILLAQQLLALQRPDLAQLVIGLRQLEAVGA